MGCHSLSAFPLLHSFLRCCASHCVASDAGAMLVRGVPATWWLKYCSKANSKQGRHARPPQPLRVPSPIPSVYGSAACFPSPDYLLRSYTRPAMAMTPAGSWAVPIGEHAAAAMALSQPQSHVPSAPHSIAPSRMRSPEVMDTPTGGRGGPGGTSGQSPNAKRVSRKCSRRLSGR